MEDLVCKGDIVFYARTLAKVGIFEILELKVRTVQDTYFVGTDKRTKQAFAFGYNAIGKTVFKNRMDALDVVKIIEEKSIQ